MSPSRPQPEVTVFTHMVGGRKPHSRQVFGPCSEKKQIWANWIWTYCTLLLQRFQKCGPTGSLSRQSFQDRGLFGIGDLLELCCDKVFRMMDPLEHFCDEVFRILDLPGTGTLLRECVQDFWTDWDPFATMLSGFWTYWPVSVFFSLMPEHAAYLRSCAFLNVARFMTPAAFTSS